MAFLCAALTVWGWQQMGAEGVVLGTGLFASATLGLLYWSARLARRRARTLFETNTALAQILDDARAELSAERDSHRSIELEVAQRTQELREAVPSSMPSTRRSRTICARRSARSSILRRCSERPSTSVSTNPGAPS